MARAGSAPPAVVFATCAALPDGDPDDRLAATALEQLGVGVRFAVWDDPAADFSAPTIVRSTWDYPARREQFLAWARRAAQVHNPPSVLAWNTDKAYLAELAAAGLPVVPSTTLAPAGAAAVSPATLAQAVESALAAGAEVVVKPAVSAGSRDTRRHGDPGTAVEHARELLADGRTVLVQPYLSRVDRDGETAVVAIGGEVSHTVRKGPLLATGAEATAGLFATESIEPREARPAELAVAALALDHVRACFGVLLYARVDLVPADDGSPLILELELAEPSLFLGTAPGSAERFARAVVAAVGSTAPGPTPSPWPSPPGPAGHDAAELPGQPDT